MYTKDIQRNDMKSITAMLETFTEEFRNAKFIIFGGSQVKCLEQGYQRNMQIEQQQLLNHIWCAAGKHPIRQWK